MNDLFDLSHAMMQKRRVLLVCSPHLFGEGMEMVLRAAEDIELIGPKGLDEDVSHLVAESRPDLVVIADEDPRSEKISRLTARLIDQTPELPVIRAGLMENVFRVYSTHMLPARGTDLLDSIRNLPGGEGRLNENRNQ